MTGHAEAASAAPPGHEPGRPAEAGALVDTLAALRDTAGQAGTVAAGFGALLRAELAYAWRSALLLVAAALAAVLVATVLWVLACALLATGLLALGLGPAAALAVLAGLNALLLLALSLAASRLGAALGLPRSRAALATLRHELGKELAGRPGDPRHHHDEG